MLDILCAYLFLAAGIVSNKYILASISAELFVALRMLISGTFLMLYNWHQTERLTYAQIKKDQIKLLAIAACTTFIPALLKAWSLQRMLVTKQSLLGSVDPFITALMVYALFGEKISRTKIIGMVVGFLGVVLVILSKNSGAFLGAAFSPADLVYLCYESFCTISYPEIAILSSVVISRYGWILVQTLLRNKEYTPIQINGLVQIVAGSLALCLALTIIVYKAYTNQLTLYEIPSYPHFIIAFIITVLGGNIIGYTLYAYSLKHHSATLVSLAGFSIPLLVALFAYIFLGERLTVPLIIGGVIIFIGLLIFYGGEKLKKIVKNH